jgi:transposase
MRIVQQVQHSWKRLSHRERRWLVGESMRAEDAAWRMRCKIVRNLARGETPMRISSILGCGRSQVYRVANRFLEHGPNGLVDRREDNGDPKVTEEFEWTVLIAVATSPQSYGYQRPTWTQELLVLVTAEQTGIRVSTTTMSRLLARHRVRHGRPKPVVDCPWPQTQKTRCLNRIRRLRGELSPGEVLLYVDEVDIHLNPKIGADWMLHGQQKTVMTPGKNEKRYLAGALNAVTGRLAWVEGLRKTSGLFIELVDHLIKRAYPWATKIYLILDNFRIHSSRAVEAARAHWGERVELHFLPPYCPDENRIERLWKDLHDNVTRNHTCSDMDTLMQCVDDYLKPRRRSGAHRYTRAA